MLILLSLFYLFNNLHTFALLFKKRKKEKETQKNPGLLFDKSEMYVDVTFDGRSESFGQSMAHWQKRIYHITKMPLHRSLLSFFFLCSEKRNV